MVFDGIVKVLASLNSNRRPGELAAGISFGFLIGLQPGFTLIAVVVLVITFFLKVNLAAELLFALVFSLIAPLLDGLLDSLGGFILTLPSLEGTFTTLYNAPILPLTNFNNTIVMGGFVLGIVLWLPVFFAGRALVKLYREKLRPRLEKSKVIKKILSMPVIAPVSRFVSKITRVSQSI